MKRGNGGFEGDFQVKNRLNNLRKELVINKLDCLLITDNLNRRYLSGFTGSAGSLLITGKNNYLITDFRYTEQANKETKNFKIIESIDTNTTLLDILKREKIKKIGIESNNITLTNFRNIKNKLKGFKIVPTSNIVEELRQIKDEKEIMFIKKAKDIAIHSLNSVLGIVKPDIREKDIAIELECQMKKNGAEKTAFDLIIASGERSSMPHSKTSEKKLKNKELILFDIGASVNGYNSDLTRVFCLGIMSRKQKDIYDIVYKAREKALSEVKSGIETRIIDSLSRSLIEKKGFGNNFRHGTGHGVGLAIHEIPQINLKKGEYLKEGMVTTIEPGIYIPGWGGIRIEDMVIVRKNGCELISKASDKLISL